MSITTTETTIRRDLLKAGDLGKLFHTIGWDNPQLRKSVVVIDGDSYTITPVRQKHNVYILECVAGGDGKIPPYKRRRKLQIEASKFAAENILIFVNKERTEQVWHWVRREKGRTVPGRDIAYHSGQSGDVILQTLVRLTFTMQDEYGLNLLGVLERVNDVSRRESVTRDFYNQFNEQHATFLRFIENIPDPADARWYASVLINRVMFLYFIQSKGFLIHPKDAADKQTRYLQNRLAECANALYYKAFLCPLFFDGLAKRKPERPVSPDFGNIPYLNGGLFNPHAVEEKYRDENGDLPFAIPNEAFEKLFAFLDGWNWHLDERPIAEGNNINPDVLGYIFEKYINNKQMGAYYTKEDITGYIGKNTILPFLFDRVRVENAVSFTGADSVWKRLEEDPDAYIYEAVRHGASLPLPDYIEAGRDDVSKRTRWNEAAPESHALPTEIWREVVARRDRYAVVREKLVTGQVSDIRDFITYNLDIRQFTLDVILETESIDLVKAFWVTLNGSEDGSTLPLSILDPTCGSGAFLFAALEILTPIYQACLDRMNAFLTDAERLGKGESAYPAFRKVRDEFNKPVHTNLDYYLLKKIIVNNLFGVDIMDEATEICKLRLFLRLASLADPDPSKDNLGVEPLPDIDFNIRAGNTLVGMATKTQFDTAFGAKGGMQMTSDADRAAIDAFTAKLTMYDATFRQFQAAQLTEDAVSAQPATKQMLTALLVPLRETADTVYARANYLSVWNAVPDKERLAAFRKSHKPFHWFVEFYGVMKAGGFDCVIGNPPYVSVNKVDYKTSEMKGSKFSDIYAHICTRCLSLVQKNAYYSLIVPLSLAFSEDFGELRKDLTNHGQSWYSSYDILPSPLFNGVAQRCTIFLCAQGDKKSFVTQMHRWRSVYRPNLFENLIYTQSDSKDWKSTGIPKHHSDVSVRVLDRVTVASSKTGTRVVPKDKLAKSKILYAKAALNFVSVYLQPPPLLHGETLSPLQSTQIGFLPVRSDSVSRAALACLSGESYLWYWLTRGDGFHVTGGILYGYIAAINALPDTTFDLLSRLGSLLHERRNEALVFKHHAAQYVGNYNYRGMFQLTRRADLLFFSGVGASRDDSLETLNYIQRLLSINVFAGEKSIPPKIKSLFPRESVNEAEQGELFSEVDKVLTKYYGFSHEELDFIINRDIKFGITHDAGE